MTDIQEASAAVSAAFSKAAETLAEKNLPLPLIAGSVMGLAVRMFREMGATDEEIVIFVRQTLVNIPPTS